MNYPIQGLTIIAPIVFLVLMIGIPVIGVFAGWKRAAYWGGGTFFFFLVGVIIWKTAGQAISNSFVPMLNNLLKDLGVSVTTKLVASLVAPAFFLVVMLAAEIILVINYYAWFKRVSGIKKDIAAKREYKQAIKDGKKPSKNNVEGWTAMQLTTKGKVINMACGGAGMALLLAPTTVTFTQAIMYTTTSSATRANASFCANLYSSLEKTAGAFSWMSYYGNADTGKDYDSLFSTMTLMNQTITYIDPVTGQASGSKTVMEAVGDSAANGIKNVVSKATDTTVTDPQTKLTNITGAVDSFAASWNNIINQAGDSVTSVFQSSNVTEMFESILPNFVGDGGIQVDVEQVVDAYGEGSVFKNIIDKAKQGYAEGQTTIDVSYVDKDTGKTIKGEIDALQSIPVTQEAFNNIKDAFAGIINTDAIKDDAEAQKTFDSALTDILSMMFYVA